MGLARQHPRTGEFYRKGCNSHKGTGVERPPGRTRSRRRNKFSGRFFARSDRERTYPSYTPRNQRHHRRPPRCGTPARFEKNHLELQIEEVEDRTKRLHLVTTDDESSLFIVTISPLLPGNAGPTPLRYC